MMENADCIKRFRKTKALANIVSKMPTSINPAMRGILQALSSNDTSVNS